MQQPIGSARLACCALCCYHVFRDFIIHRRSSFTQRWGSVSACISHCWRCYCRCSSACGGWCSTARSEVDVLVFNVGFMYRNTRAPSDRPYRPGVTIGVVLVHEIMNLILPNLTKNVGNRLIERRLITDLQKATALTDLHSFLSVSMPFGTCSNTNHLSTMAPILAKTIPPPSADKQPAWRPISHKGKGSIHLVITEFVRGVSYDSKVQSQAQSYYILTLPSLGQMLSRYSALFPQR